MHWSQLTDIEKRTRLHTARVAKNNSLVGWLAPPNESAVYYNGTEEEKQALRTILALRLKNAQSACGGQVGAMYWCGGGWFFTPDEYAASPTHRGDAHFQHWMDKEGVVEL